MARKFEPISLQDPYLKTTRAKIHLDTLRDGINAFHESEPIRIFRKDDVERQLYCIRLVIGEVPSSLALIAGDFFYCLRSALDQTVWALVKRKMGSGYPTHTQFPIFDHNTSRNRTKFSQYTAGIPAAAIGIIRSLQPYHRTDPATHLLSRLNKLCNIDKHRRIPVHSRELLLSFPQATRDLVRLMKFDESQAMVSVPLNYKSQMAFDPRASFKVVFGDMADGVSCDLEGMDSMYDFVANKVIPRFARFFS